ncbi:ATP-dependent RNA helicase DbpA [Halobacteriovorax sp. HLS]|uniref:ATP-dependent RNA helicase DbpA n=1 Tax=Halobacteriovorax sp. HLS TaxID=2234000 RepID=UPI000FD8655C|nr:ATP-dependent RNA helicase DbpA [Halobacteriovorax sp. HLS]
MTKNFKDFKLNESLLINLEELNFKSMTPVQEMSLPHVLDGKDVLAQAKTGSGKTAAFGLGILNQLDLSRMSIQSLVLCPTRELAEQVAKELRTLARMQKNVKVLTICGGMAQIHQENSLAHGAHIIVGTPGRVLRLIKCKALQLHRVETLVLDEADKMLDMGFYDDILTIREELVEDIQTLLFSATFPDEIKSLSKDLQEDAIEVTIDVEHDSSSIDQAFFEMNDHQQKNQALIKILANYKPERLIVFCKTKVITDNVAKLLNKEGILACAIHGDLEQNERTSVLTKFSNRSLSVLVATDVAARGLDIKDLEAVINFDLPNNAESYVHRIGRTARAGKNGQAFSLFTRKDLYILDDIEELTNLKCNIENIDDLSDEKTYDLSPPMKTMFIAGGKKSKLRPGDILGALVGEAGIAATDVGNISILNVVSFVAIKSELIDSTIQKLQNGKIKNKKFRVGLA